METEVVDFAIVTGDIDQGVGDDYDNIFFGVYKDMLKRDCHFTCIGNHDTYADNAATYMDDFYMFSNNPSNTERYYSFEWGDAKIICLDANLDYTSGSDQFNWMIDEFKCHDKKWLFIFFHQPPWTNAWSLDYYIPLSPYFLYQGDEDMRSDLVPEFEKYKVDFVVNGHSHCYQRGEMNGVQYLVTGGAGASTLDANTNSNSPNLSVEIYENHYVRFDISGDTAKYVMINDNGLPRDSVTVIKGYNHYTQSISGTDLSCNSASDGSISLTVSGEKTPYTYLWNSGQTTANLTGIAAGTYSVIITDSVGCERFDTITINEPPAMNTQVFSSTGEFVLCDGSAITLTATGNSAGYSWSTGETTASVSVTLANTYSLTTFDTLGCSSLPFVVTVTVGSAPSGISFQHSASGLNATFSTTESGSYQWDFGDGNSSALQNPVHSYTASDLYTVQLIVQNSCGSDTTVQAINISNTSIDNIESMKLLNLQVQPNPFSEYSILTFDNPGHKNFSVTITDLQGRELRHYTSIKSGSVKIEKGTLLRGAYLYTLKNKEFSVSGKLIVE